MVICGMENKMKQMQGFKHKILIAGVLLIMLCIAGVVISFSFETSKGRKMEKREGAALEDAQILVLGDSIFGLLRNYGRLENVLKESLGAKVYNNALGGTGAAVPKDGGSLHFANLAKAIRYSSFANMERDAEVIEATSIYYVDEVLQRFKTIDYQAIDYVIISYGANDYFNQVPINDYWFYKSEHTYKGALRKGIKDIQEACPQAVIILCTPIYCNFERQEQFEGDSNSMDLGQGTLKAYADAVKEVAGEYGIDYIDGFSQLEINESSWEDYLIDGIHPNWAGMKLYGSLITEKLKEIEGR